MITQFQDGHVLDEDGIDTDSPEILKELAGGIEFIVVEDGIDGYIDLDAEGMGIFAELADVVDTVACRRTGSETRRPDIDGIGAMIDGGYATCEVLGRRQQFK